MSVLIGAALVIIGSLFCIIAAVGLLRLPDTLIRMHAATKAGTLGAGCILLAVAFEGQNTSTTLKALAVIIFLLLTAPVAAHLIGKAAYHRGIRLYERTRVDELAQEIKRQKAANDLDLSDRP